MQQLLIFVPNHHHLQRSPILKNTVERVELKSELRCFAFLTSACETTSKLKLNKQAEAAARAKQQKPYQGAITSHSSTKRLCSKLPLRTWWITIKGNR